MTDPKETQALADRLLAQIRAEARPLVKIHVGSIEQMAEDQARPSQMANQFVAEWTEDPDNQADDAESSTALEAEWVDVSEWEHEIGWKWTEDDAEAWELERRIVLERAKAKDPAALKIFPHFMATDGFNAFAWHGKWYHYGCQSIEIDEKFAASLCATKIAKSELDYVRLPWPCFIVRVPKFLQTMTINGERLKSIVVNHVRYSGPTSVVGQQKIEGAHVDFDRYQLHLITSNKYRILPAQSLSQWAEPNPMRAYDEIRLMEVEHSEIDRRQLEVIGRLVLGAIISMNEPKFHKTYGRLPKGKKPSLGSPRYGTHNDVMLHKVGKPVRVDARDTIAAYVTGQTGRVTNVRTLVAGHWKNQPHGPKSSLRRWQHIECYWRGDEDAPRIVRPHVLAGDQ